MAPVQGNLLGWGFAAWWIGWLFGPSKLFTLRKTRRNFQMQELQQRKYVKVPRLHGSYASKASFASRRGASLVTWCELVSWLFFAEVEWVVLCQDNPPNTRSSLSTRPCWRTVSLSSSWSEEIRYFRYLRPSSSHDQLLSMRWRTLDNLGPAAPWMMVSCNAFASPISI